VKSQPNGYVMTPGSRHHSGVTYGFASELRPWTAELEPVPDAFRPPPAPESNARAATGLKRPEGPLVAALKAIPTEVYVEALVGKRPDSSGKLECPFHSDWSPSFHAYPGDRGWFCFQCEPLPGRSMPGRGGDIFTLAAALWGLDCGRDFPLIVKHLSNLIGG
jgi:hypothetical protein